jgi:hypothetical protein
MEKVVCRTLAALVLGTHFAIAAPTQETTQACAAITKALPGKVLTPALLALEYEHEIQQYWSTTLRSVDPACIVQPDCQFCYKEWWPRSECRACLGARRCPHYHVRHGRSHIRCGQKDSLCEAWRRVERRGWRFGTKWCNNPWRTLRFENPYCQPPSSCTDKC